ncbi:MAG TPA: site-2 protease family protein [Candidatus Omnitrophota bacterium]|nr:site-2 protease family protein [Candidatus Omnitrophota bacterium]
MIVTILLLLIAITIHEVGHGYVAHRLGDDTAKRHGRLTLNPLRHIDPFWTVLLPVMLFMATKGSFIFAMAKPVPVDFSQLRNPRRDMVWVALAGPLTNILLATALAFLFQITNNNVYVLYGVYMNLGLALFNLVPIPPLDGSRVLAGMLPARWVLPYLRLERFGFLLVVLFYMSGLLMQWVVSGMNFFCYLLQIPTLT